MAGQLSWLEHGANYRRGREHSCLAPDFNGDIKKNNGKKEEEYWLIRCDYVYVCMWT